MTTGDTRLEELLITEFKDAIKSLRNEVRELEKELVIVKTNAKVSLEVKKAERATIAVVAAAASGVVAMGVKLLESINK